METPDVTPIPTPADASHRRHLVAFFIVAVILLAAGIGLRDPWPSDEPRFTLVAKTMVESGDWMFPRRGSELYSDKPPMMMWLEAASYTVVREWRIAFLLPSLLAALGTLWLTYDLGRRLWSPRVGLYAAIGALSAFQFMYQMKRAQIDPLITFWITLSLWGLLIHCLKGPDWRKYGLACFAAGLGVITKGVGIIALLVLLPYAFARARGWDGVTRPGRGEAWRWLLGIVAFLAAIALWLVPMLIAAQSRAAPEYAAYVNDILFHQTAKRYADSWSHIQPLWYYGPILLFNWFPLSLGYFGAVPRWWRALEARDARVLLPLAWIALIVVFFSIPDGKRDVYVMPAVPMMALLIAPYVDEMLASRWLPRLAFACAVFGGVVLLFFGLEALSTQPLLLEDAVRKSADRLATKHGLLDGGRSAWWMFITMGAAFLAAAAIFRPRRGVQALLAGIASLWLLYSFWAYPLFNASASSAGVMARVGEIVPAGDEIGMVAWKEQNLLMADRPMHDFGFKVDEPEQFRRGAAWLAEAPARRWLFAKATAMGECVVRERALRVGESNRREWWLVRHDAVVPGCVPRDPEDVDGVQDDDAGI